MINGVISSNIFPSIGYAISASAGGRMSLPVSPGAVIYSQFEHVSGVAAPEGARGVAITKLKILDTLIDQLDRMKKQTIQLPDSGGDAAQSDARLDALIEQYESQIRTAQAAPYAVSPQSGALFSLAA